VCFSSESLAEATKSNGIAQRMIMTSIKKDISQSHLNLPWTTYLSVLSTRIPLNARKIHRESHHFASALPIQSRRLLATIADHQALSKPGPSADLCFPSPTLTGRSDAIQS
jgi:hypothetical protein